MVRRRTLHLLQLKSRWKHRDLEKVAIRWLCAACFSTWYVRICRNRDSLIFSTRGDLWSSRLDGNDAKPLSTLMPSSPVMSWVLQKHSVYLTELDKSSHEYRPLRYRNGQLPVLGSGGGMLVSNASDVAVSPDERWLVYARQDSSSSDLKIRKSIFP
jgi:hypothetical protein